MSGLDSSQIYYYLKKYQDDPTSRCFAPLAEAYRKAGLVDEAIEIAREGLQVHPQYLSGKVALARALFDKKQYKDVLRELGTVIRDAPDNLIAQKLLAESHLLLGHTKEALEHFKLLLYFNPQDQDAAQIVFELESQAYEKGLMAVRKAPATQAPKSTTPPRPQPAAPAPAPTPMPKAPPPPSPRDQKIARLESLLRRLQR